MENFVREQKLLLELEKQAVLKKEEEELKKNGRLTEVEVISVSIPKYGGVLVNFRKRNPNIKTCPTFKERENIALELVNGSKPLKGIVVKQNPKQYTIHLSKTPELFKTYKKWNFIKISDNRQFNDMEAALNKISINQTPLRDVLMGIKAPSLQENTFLPKLQNSRLDYSQMEAVIFALNQMEVSVIHGPPGTGKTTTLVEIILQSVKRGEKVLLTTASNTALDNIGEKLAQEGLHVARVGHPARISEAMLPHSISALAMKVKEDLGKRKIQRSLENLMEDYLKKADIVLSTLTSCRKDGPIGNLPNNYFDVTVIEECGQAMEMSCWTAIHKSPKLILAGDHLQLPPTVISEKAKKKLSISLMERLQDLLQFNSLETQYRMNALIMNWSSSNFYNNTLQADKSVRNHKLLNLPGVATDEITRSVLRLIDTSGLDMPEISNDSTTLPSYANKEEAALIIEYVEGLLKKGLAPIQIAIITPYSYQVELLKSNIKYPGIQVSSVDAFQGREKEVVIISLVRSNKEQNLGFLIEERRINVAITRARKQIVLICNTSTIKKDPFLRNLIQYISTNGDVESISNLDTSNLLLPMNGQ